MRADHRRNRLDTAHNTIAGRHPHREILWQAVRPVVVPGTAVVAVLAVIVWCARSIHAAVPAGRWVLLGAAVFVALLLAGLVVSSLRSRRTGIPRSWRKYM